ncbi:13391_t:CDS:1, partial [Acaulospora morrowiae]
CSLSPPESPHGYFPESCESINPLLSRPVPWYNNNDETKSRKFNGKTEDMDLDHTFYGHDLSISQGRR